MLKKISLCLLSIFVIFTLSSCGEEVQDSKSSNNTPASSKPAASPAVQEDEVDEFDGNVEIIITMQDGKTMELELYPEVAPITVTNFVRLINEGFYDGLTFHRIISGFMIQGGDPQGTGTGGSDKNIKGEFKSNGVENTLSHVRGVISMARSGNPDSASSQFFIVHADSPHLDGDYASFGKMTAGFETLDELAETPTTNGQTPAEKPVIQSIKIKE